jgi:hypothetical protein
MTIEFEPNGVECNGVECDGALDTNVYIYPTFFAAAIFFNQLALVDNQLPTGPGYLPIIFYVPQDPPAFEIPEDMPAFLVPAPRGRSY